MWGGAAGDVVRFSFWLLQRNGHTEHGWRPPYNIPLGLGQGTLEGTGVSKYLCCALFLVRGEIQVCSNEEIP